MKSTIWNDFACSFVRCFCKNKYWNLFSHTCRVWNAKWGLYSNRDPWRQCLPSGHEFQILCDSVCMESIMQITQICCKMWYVAFTRVFGPFITKTIANHRTLIWVKPLKNHWCQWSICKKTFNGDGQGVAKPLKNHRWQWCPEEKTLPSHRLKKMTIVEVYTPVTTSNVRFDS